MGACLNALVCGSLRQLWQSFDSLNISAYRNKGPMIEALVKHRNLGENLRQAIIAQCEYLWIKERQLGGYDSNFLTK